MDNNQWNGQQPVDPNMQNYGQPMDPNMQAYGQPMDPNMAYGQPNMAYGQPMDPNMAYGQPAAPAPAKSKKGLIIGIIAAFAVIAIVVVLILVLKKGGSGKAEERECEMCYQTKMCKEYTVTAFGESEDGWFCDDCYNEMKTYVEMFGGKIKAK